MFNKLQHESAWLVLFWFSNCRSSSCRDSSQASKMVHSSAVPLQISLPPPETLWRAICVISRDMGELWEMHRRESIGMVSDFCQNRQCCFLKTNKYDNKSAQQAHKHLWQCGIVNYIFIVDTDTCYTMLTFLKFFFFKNWLRIPTSRVGFYTVIWNTSFWLVNCTESP